LPRGGSSRAAVAKLAEDWGRGTRRTPTRPRCAPTESSHLLDLTILVGKLVWSTLGVSRASGVSVGSGEVAAGCQGSGVVRAEQSLGGSQDNLEQFNRLAGMASGQIGEAKVVADAPRVGVIRVEQSFGGGQDSLE